MTTSALMKTILHNSIADGLYNEVVTRHSRYYYYLGKTVTWTDELTPPYPTDSQAYEFASRNDIITMKEIKPTDIAFVIPRYNWTSGTIYDQYDDQYSTEVQGVNLTAGGFGYGSDPFVYIGSQGSVNWAASTSYILGKLIKSGNNYYIVTTTGVTGTTLLRILLVLSLMVLLRFSGSVLAMVVVLVQLPHQHELKEVLLVLH